MANLPHIAAKCAEIHPIIAPGLTYTAGLIWSAVAAGLGFLSGWYAKGRGMSGMKIDIDNTKLEIEKVKNLVASKIIPQAVTVVTPVSGTKITDTGTVIATPSI